MMRVALSRMMSASLLLMTGGILAPAGVSAPLLTQSGSHSSFSEILKSGALPKGENSKRGVKGSVIQVNRQLVEPTPESRQPIPQAIKIHTLGNSAIPRGDFPKWSRWYQEDGSTQIFRLFKGEENLRNALENAARVEAFSEVNWERGRWHEWSGAYTIVKPHGAAIFQAKTTSMTGRFRSI